MLKKILLSFSEKSIDQVINLLSPPYVFSADHAALVVKASGLAAGKGVIVAPDRAAACAAVHDMLDGNKMGAAGHTVIVEELLTGQEVSVSLCSI